jgi:hypothetical protein
MSGCPEIATSIMPSPVHDEWDNHEDASSRLFALFCVRYLRYDQGAVKQQHVACYSS